MIHPPRRWQTEAHHAVLDWRRTKGADPAAIRAIMGAGKTRFAHMTIASELAAMDRAGVDRSVVVAVPTQLLVEQTVSEFSELGLACGEYWQKTKRVEQVTVSTYDSLPNVVQRLGSSCSLAIYDEAHQTEARKVLAAHEALKPLYLLGLSATLFRADEEDSLSLFKTLLYDYGPQQALADGVVVPWRIMYPEVNHGDSIDLVCLRAVQVALKPCIVTADTTPDADAYVSYLQGHGVRVAAVHSKLKGTAETMERLRVGELEAVVHVRMLTEGVNYPWLRSLVLRVPMESRVRFAQMVGRVLRSHPGKEYAEIWDPNDLFGDLSIDYEACLGGEPAKVKLPKKGPLEITAEEWGRLFELPSEDRQKLAEEAAKVFRKSPMALRVPMVVQLVRRLAVAWAAAGKLPFAGRDVGWRRAEATLKQRQSLEKMGFLTHKTRCPEDARLLRLACEAAADGQLTRGSCSDLFSILRIVYETGQIWPTVEEK